MKSRLNFGKCSEVAERSVKRLVKKDIKEACLVLLVLVILNDRLALLSPRLLCGSLIAGLCGCTLLKK